MNGNNHLKSDPEKTVNGGIHLKNICRNKDLKGIKYIKIFLILSVFSILVSSEIAGDNRAVFDSVPASNLHNARLISMPDGTTGYTVSDLTYRDSRDPFIHDLTISFNEPPEKLRRDESGKYVISEAFYNFVKDKGSLGGGAANFFRKNHRVVIEAGSRQWLGTCGDTGSFTIEFRIKPATPDGVIFSRTGYFSGRKTGIEIRVKNYSIITDISGIFEKPDGTRHDLSLGGRHRISSDKWSHFALSYDRLSGRLSHVINGDEISSVYLTATGSPYGDVYTPYFVLRDDEGELNCYDVPRAVIGEGFSGLLDEFRISYKQYDDLEKRTAIAYRDYLKVQEAGRVPLNIEGVVTSPVYDFENTGTKITSFSWDEMLKDDTFIWMEFRISDSRFAYDDHSPGWYRIDNEQKNIYLHRNEKGEFLRGRYMQWRAHLVSSPDGRNAPLLSNINMTFQTDHPPAPPRFLEVLDQPSSQVVLRWRKNVEPDILGYKIYYGVYPGRYDGIITRVEGERITNKFSEGDSITVTLTNEIIEENKKRDKRRILRFPPLRNGVLYYFAVSAYDSYKPDTVYNHESDLSKPVSARPFPGTEIK